MSEPKVENRKTAIRLTLKKWKKIQVLIIELAKGFDKACGFCHLALYKKQLQAHRGNVPVKSKCHFCEKDAHDLCNEMLETFADHLSELSENTEKNIRFLRLIKRAESLKSD